MKMENCSVCKKLKIVPGNIKDYKALASYHYRDGKLGPYTNIFTLKGDSVQLKNAGVIVYTTPRPALELRSVATGNAFIGFDRSTQLALVNKYIRCISRVIIEPRLRGLGLAVRLVHDTMPLLNVPIIEAMAVMGHINPFFEKAGMKAYTAKMPASCIRLIEAMSLVGIEQNELIDENRVHQKLEQLHWPKADFIERQIQLFLQCYGNRRNMPAGLERTRFVLSKMTERPVYYIWFNPNLMLDTREESSVEHQQK
jgi:hypothetical protein